MLKLPIMAAQLFPVRSTVPPPQGARQATGRRGRTASAGRCGRSPRSLRRTPAFIRVTLLEQACCGGCVILQPLRLNVWFVRPADLRPAYPGFDAFVALRDRLDPERRFSNPYLERVLG